MLHRDGTLKDALRHDWVTGKATTERHVEKKPKDPTNAEKFNPYPFVGYKEQVIELLLKLYAASVEMMKMVKEMPGKICHCEVVMPGVATHYKRRDAAVL